MGDSLRLVRGAWVVMAALVVLLLLQINGWRRDLTYNEAVRAGDYALAARAADQDRAMAARAYATADGEFEEKVRLLSVLVQSGREPLADDARFNLANLYLRRALALDDEDRDILVPLVEQAKQHYRTLLAADPDDWACRYNLELALTMLPETAEQAADEERNPERSERAISTMRVEEQLP